MGVLCSQTQPDNLIKHSRCVKIKTWPRRPWNEGSSGNLAGHRAPVSVCRPKEPNKVPVFISPRQYVVPKMEKTLNVCCCSKPNGTELVTWRWDINLWFTDKTKERQFHNCVSVGYTCSVCVCVLRGSLHVCVCVKVTHPVSVTPLLKCPFLFYFTPLRFAILGPC